ncbi:hypothetical protein D3C87_446670 [compost metagenome]
MVRVDTDHGGMGCFVINNLGMPQATQGSFYSFQSFFEENQKKDLHCYPSRKTHSRKKKYAGYPFVLDT